MSEDIRVAVIGCGGIAREIYLPLLDASDEARICACVDASEGARETLCGRYPNAHVLPSATELDPASCDCALVLTPVREGVDAHYEPVLALMQAGVPTLCEKPLSAELSRAEAMVAAAESAGTLLMMSVNRRFAPVYRRAFEHFEGQEIAVCIAEKSGAGGIFREIVTNSLHTLDAMRWLCGEVAHLAGWMHSEGETDLRASVSMQFEPGALGSFVMSRDAGRWIERLVLHGEGRTAIVDAPREVELITGGDRVRWSPDQCCWQLSEAERWGFGAQLRHFFACVRGEEQPHVPPRDALLSQQLAERVRALA
ncbi:MAG: Gfo/Idh/MocA family protein [Armatimonadota bacterium]|jgi:virulence factor